MLRIISKRFAPVAALSMALALPLAGHAEPVVRLSIAAPHDIDTFIGDFCKLGEKPEKAAMIREPFVRARVYDESGIDTTKRLGIILNLPAGAPPQPTILIQILDETKFLSSFKPFFPNQEKLPDGRWKLMGDPKTPPLAIRIDKGWAYINVLSEKEIAPPAEPAKLVDGKGMIELDVSVSSIPDAMKNQIVAGIKQGGEAKAQALQSEAEKAQAKAGTEAMVTAMNKFFAQTDSLGFAIEMSTKEFKLDFEMKTKAGVPGAAAAPGQTIGLSKLVPATAAVGFTSDMSLDEMARSAMKESAKTAFEAAKKQGGPPAKIKFLEAMESEVQNLVATGRVEGMAMVDGKKGDANIVLAVRTAPDSKMNDVVKLVVDEASKKPDAAGKPVVKAEGPVTFYTVDSPNNKSMAADLGGSEVTLAVRPGLMAMAIGGKTIDKLKATLTSIDANKPEAGGIGSTKGWFGLRSFADIAGIATFAKTKADEELFTKYVTAGADQIGFTLEPQKDGYKSAIYVQGGLVALMARGAMKDPASAPAPGLDQAPAPGQGGGEAAPASAAPEAPASAEPEASPEASPAPEGDGEKEEGDKNAPAAEKKEEGDGN